MVKYLPATGGQCPPGYGFYPSETPLGPAGCYAPNGDVVTTVTPFLPAPVEPAGSGPDLFPTDPCTLFPWLCSPVPPLPIPDIWPDPFGPGQLPSPPTPAEFCGPDAVWDATTMRCIPRVGTIQAGSCVWDPVKGSWVIRTLRPARMVTRKARPVFNPVTGQLIGCRAKRSMNPLNPRALKRALSRACAFEKFARKAISVTSMRWKRKPKSCARKRRAPCQA